jgi:AcrR family transcriptional regulator
MATTAPRRAGPAPGNRGDATRAQLVAAAEQLWAERGIDAVSLREVNSAAGQRNSTALQYHFGDREGLLRAVVGKHHHGVEAARHALLDQYEAGPGGDVRALAGALVRPSAAKLADADGGRAYLRILAQLVNRPDFVGSAFAHPDPRSSIERWRGLVGPLLPEETVDRLHPRFTAIRIHLVELARRAEQRPARDDRLFVSHLVDVVTAVLTAPNSDETTRLLAERDARRRARATS